MPDRFTEFRTKMEALTAYRDAYFEAGRANLALIAGLPDPDDDPNSFDPAEALATLRGRTAGGEPFRPAARSDIET